MGKILTEKKDCDILDEILSKNESMINCARDLNYKQSKHKKTLSSYVKYIDSNNFDDNTLGISFGMPQVGFNEELSNAKIRYIATELAQAIDNNSPEAVRKIKKEYGDTKEFLKAKEFLNKKCKEVWNVFDNKKEQINIPYEAMKTLGITNQPSLDFLLDESLKYYEKDNGTTTIDIINSTLNNKNINYTFSDIYSYLKTTNKKHNYKLNFKTTAYFIKKLDYNEEKLCELGIEKDAISKVLKSFKPIERIYYFIKNRIPFLKA